MRDVFGEAKQRLAREIDSHSALTEKPIAADPWVVSSLLQKSIRRGETEIAGRAALTFVKLKGSAIWRRLTVIAFEDIGIGSVDALTMNCPIPPLVEAGGFDAVSASAEIHRQGPSPQSRSHRSRN